MKDRRRRCRCRDYTQVQTCRYAHAPKHPFRRCKKATVSGLRPVRTRYHAYTHIFSRVGIHMLLCTCMRVSAGAVPHAPGDSAVSLANLLPAPADRRRERYVGKVHGTCICIYTEVMTDGERPGGQQCDRCKHTEIFYRHSPHTVPNIRSPSIVSYHKEYHFAPKTKPYAFFDICGEEEAKADPLSANVGLGFPLTREGGW